MHAWFLPPETLSTACTNSVPLRLAHSFTLLIRVASPTSASLLSGTAVRVRVRRLVAASSLKR
jgi:hypothetical protein